MSVSDARRARPLWFWLFLASVIIVAIGLSFPIGWLMAWAFPRISSFSIVEPLTVALLAFAAFLVVLFLFRRTSRRTR